MSPPQDTLTGANGNDTLIGGVGNDSLTGGAGSDRFVFSTPGQSLDTITDFVVADDTIDVSAAGFKGGLIASSAITPQQFVIGAKATDSFNRFIYNNTNGNLLFDVDGTGSIASVVIANLSPNLQMTNADIFVIA